MENYIWILFAALGVLGLMELSKIARSLQSTEAMMKRRLSHDGIEWETPVEPCERVKELALNPKSQIAAIKAYREQTGLGLREAKAVVDALSRSHQSAA